MKKAFLLLFVVSIGFNVNAQKSDKELITKTCMNYIEGFYEGNTDKLKLAIKPNLQKFGFWKSSKTNKYSKPIPMTFEGALKFAENVKKKQNF